MKKIIKFFNQFGIDSFSELRYKNRKLMNWLVGFLILFYFVEGELLEKEGLIISGFMLWGCLAVAARYKERKDLRRMHYLFAFLFFLPSVIYGGWFTLVIPLIAFGYLYWKHKKEDIHLLVFEILLFITTQIGILI